MPPKPIRGELPKIDFKAIMASAGDLRDIVARELGPPDRNKKYPCPFHDERTASFHVYHDRFKCYGCGEHGNKIDWFVKRHGVSVVEAARQLGWVGDAPVGSRSGRPARPSPAPPPPPPVPSPTARDLPPVYLDPEWQRLVGSVVDAAEDQLWSPRGKAALDWLRGRGLEDATIHRFRLGFIASNAHTATLPIRLERCDEPKGLFFPRGVTLPWLAPGAVPRGPMAVDDETEEPVPHRWAGLKIRRLSPDVNAPLREGTAKLLSAWGSQTGLLYPTPEIERTQGGRPILLVEGEFDALLAFQEVGHLVHVGTVGSASIRALKRSTLTALMRCPLILLGFDHDEAGVKAVRAWRERFPDKTRRIRLPFGKDLTDFHRGGGEVLSWVKEFLDELSF